MVTVTIENKKSLESIQREFSNKLSEKQILTTTAHAINDISRKVISRAKKEVKKEYTVNKKYLDRMAKLSKPAKGVQSGLYSEIYFKYNPIPIVGFKYKQIGKGRSRKGIHIEVIRGNSEILNHAFESKMKSGHIGIYARGRYVNGKFDPVKEKGKNGKYKIAEMKTASPFTMGKNKNVESRQLEYINKNLPSTTRALLQRQVDKALNTK